MHVYQVGQPYNPAVSQWPECWQYNWRGGQHELIAFLGTPSAAEVSAVRRGNLALALVPLPSAEQPQTLLQAIRLGAAPWSESLYTWHRVPEALRSLPPEPGAGRALLQVLLVDAHTGRLEAMRAVSLSRGYTDALHQLIARQAALAWDPAAHDAACAEVARRFPQTADVVRAAVARWQSER